LGRQGRASRQSNPCTDKQRKRVAAIDGNTVGIEMSIHLVSRFARYFRNIDVWDAPTHQ